MILQSISKAIREQNYYAVMLEFVIVIAGVVIGFQIQAWAEARAEQSRAQYYLNSLYLDLQLSAEEQAETEQYYLEYHRNAADISNALTRDAVDEGEVNSLATRINSLGGFRDIRVIDTTLVQLFESGDIALIQPIGLQEAITRFYSQYRLAHQGNDNATRIHLENISRLNDLVVHEWIDGARQVVAIEPDDPQLASVIESMAWAYSTYGFLQSKFTQETEAMRDTHRPYVDGSVNR